MKLRQSILALVAILTSFSLSSYAQEYVAETGGINYNSLQEAIDAATEGATITLLCDLEVASDLNNAGKGLYNIKENQRINIDLNGKTINVTDQSTGNFIIFYSYGDLTIGNGEVYLIAENNRAWNAQSTIILNRGGNLVVESGTYIHKGGTDMAITMDNSANSFGDAYMTINGGTLESTYTGIRNRMANPALNGNPGNGIAILTINGGTIQGDKRGIWGQITNASSEQLGSLTVTGGTIEGGVNSIRMDADEHDNTTVAISGDNTTIKGALAGDVEDFSISGGSYSVEIPEGFLAEGYEMEQDENGSYIPNLVYTAKTDNGDYHATLQEAIDAATEGATITILGDIALTEGVTVATDDVITLDLNGKTISRRTELEKSTAAITNNGKLTIVDNSKEKDGKITAFAKNPDTAEIPYYASNTITNCGELTIIEGTIENSTSDDARAAFPIDNNSTSRDAILTIKGGAIIGRGAIRQFANSTTHKNEVNIMGGVISGSSYAVWMQNPGSKDPIAELNISAGKIDKVLLSPSTNFDAEITGGTIKTVGIWNADQTNPERNPAGFISGGSFSEGISEDFIAEGYELVEVDGAYVPQARELALNDTDGEITFEEGVTYKKVTLNRAIKANPDNNEGWSNWSTFVVPFSMAIPDGWEVKTLTASKITDGGITLTFADAATIEAGVPYMVRTQADVTTIEVTDVTLSTELHHRTTGDVAFEGVYTSGNVPTGSYFISGNTFYRSVNTENPDKLKGYRAYIKPIAAQASNARSLGYRFASQGESEEGTTAMKTTTREATVTAIYTLDGTRISEMQQGVNILQMSNGNIVKVIIK